MKLKERIQWFVAKQITGRFYGVKFYITALNTFDGGAPGLFGMPEAARTTEALLKQAKERIERKNRLGCLNCFHGIAHGLKLATSFWYGESCNQERRLLKEREQKLILFRLLATHHIPIPLPLLYPQGLCEILAQRGCVTLEDVNSFLDSHSGIPHPILSKAAVPTEEDCQKLGEWLNFCQIAGDFDLRAR